MLLSYKIRYYKLFFYYNKKIGKASEAIRILKRINEKESELKLAILYALRIAYYNESIIGYIILLCFIINFKIFLIIL